MKKQIAVATAFAACLALCAAVWPQNEPAEETPALHTLPAVIAAQPKAPEITEAEECIMPEEERADATQPEPVEEVATAPEPEPLPVQTPPSSEVHNLTERNTTLQQEPEPAPASPDRTLDDMVYVPGFGWLESQGPNHCKYAADMYENGNKIGSMG